MIFKKKIVINILIENVKRTRRSYQSRYGVLIVSIINLRARRTNLQIIRLTLLVRTASIVIGTVGD